MIPTPPLNPFSLAAAAGSAAVFAATVVVLAPDALQSLEPLAGVELGLHELFAVLAVLFNAGAVVGVLSGPGSAAQRLIWAVLILLPLGMVAYVVFGRRTSERSTPPRDRGSAD